MKTIDLRGSWLIEAPRTAVYDIISDFEAMPRNFPKVAHRLTIVQKEGFDLTIEAEAKSLGRIIPVSMQARLMPGKGYIVDTVNETLGTDGHEELILHDERGGTRIEYSYKLNIHRWWLRLLARPLLGWYALPFWKKAVIDRLPLILDESPSTQD